jgi:hypothetical protein
LNPYPTTADSAAQKLKYSRNPLPDFDHKNPLFAVKPFIGHAPQLQIVAAIYLKRLKYGLVTMIKS